MPKKVVFKETKLYEALMLLSQKQLKDLSCFINLSGSKLNEQQKNALLGIIKLLSKRKKIDESVIVNEYFKNELQYWPKAKTHILKAIYRFLKFNAFEEDAFIGDFYLLQYFEEKKAYHNLFEFYKKASLKITNNTYINSKFKNLETTLLAKYKLNLTQTIRNIESVEFLEKITEDLNDFYIAKQLPLMVELINRHLRVTGKLYPKKNVTITNLIEHKTNNIKIKIWQHFLKLITTSNNLLEAQYEKTYELIVYNANQLTPLQLYNFILYLNNYCSTKLNSGEYQYAKLAWNNYTYLINENLFEIFKPLSPIIYLNIVLLGLKNRKLKKVNNYIKKLEPYIDNTNTDVKNAVVTIAKALKFYDKAKSKKEKYRCLNELVGFETNDVKIRFQHDKLKAKILFDLNLNKEILELIDKNINTYKKLNEGVFNFFKAIEKLIIGKNIGNLNPTDYHFSDFNWLLEKQQNL